MYADVCGHPRRGDTTQRSCIQMLKTHRHMYAETYLARNLNRTEMHFARVLNCVPFGRGYVDARVCTTSTEILTFPRSTTHRGHLQIGRCFATRVMEYWHFPLWERLRAEPRSALSGHVGVPPFRSPRKRISAYKSPSGTLFCMRNGGESEPAQ